MQMQIPKGAENIIKVLNGAGYEAYVVGGCVRDALLGKVPHDWDITTLANPYTVKSLFKRTIDTGVQHGTVTILMDGDSYEVTTYRVDGAYEDGRHPKEVKFSESLPEDLMRRDFTINAMAYHPETGLVDLYDGEADLKAGVIRAVGNPVDRFGEDALRMMRAIRFSAQLGFTIEEDTLRAIHSLAGTLHKISAERIREEVCKCLTSAHPDNFRLFYETGLTKVFLPEFDACMETAQNNPHHCYTVGEHILKSVGNIEATMPLRVAMLLHDIAKPCTKTTDENGIDHFYNHQQVGAGMAREILKRLRFDNDTIAQVVAFVEHHDARIEPTKKAMRKAIHKIGESRFPALFDIAEADVLAQSDYEREDKLARNAGRRKVYEEIILAKECISLKMLAVNGKDLIEAGIPGGKGMGEILNKMLEDVLEEPSHNTKEYLMAEYVPS